MTAQGIAIVGACSTYRQAPYGDPSYEIWGLGKHFTRLRAVDRIFEMHAREIWSPYLREEPHAYARRLVASGKPVYLREEHADIPNGVAYPLEQVIADVGDYFVSSLSYMLALAIHLQPEEIRLYGINLTSAEEYVYQRANVEYLSGLARGRGIALWSHPASPILKTGIRYGTAAWFAAGADRTAMARFNVSELVAGAKAAYREYELPDGVGEFVGVE